LPLQATDAGGAPTATYWRYTINNGTPFEVPASGGTIRVRVNEYLVTRDPTESVMRASTRGSASGTISGISVSGSLQGSGTQELVFGDTTRVAASTTTSQSAISGSGASTSVRLTMQTTYVPSYRLLLDAPDLDTLPVGHTVQDQVQATLRASGSRTVNGRNEPLQFDDVTVSGAITWRITAKMDRATVQGREYRNVVVVDLETWQPNPTLTALDRTTETYWVAKGIGPIHIQSLYSLGSRQPVLSELLDTNLVAPAAGS